LLFIFQFEVENLGSCGEFSSFLNGVATKLLPFIVRVLSQELTSSVIEPTGGDCSDDKIYPLCNLVGIIMNLLKDAVANG